MKIKTATFVTLASILATACGTESSSASENDKSPEKVKLQLESLQIKTEAVTKVGFTEVETGE